MKERLKIKQSHIYILMKKVTILRKIHTIMKSFIPPLFTTLTKGRNKTFSQFSCQFTRYSIRIGSLNCFKWGIAKTIREIVCLCCREVDAILIGSGKIPEHEESILSSSFYGHLPNY